ncbi:MAG: Uma2 family endonuclease [Planctomycetaceae bacterium]|nr:Uma2 family endonuclease [Planctomycetaceae bacterium]
MSSTAEGLTFADLLARLGDIAPQRIRLRPAPGEAVERDLLELHRCERRLYELVDGVLVEKAMGFKESIIACTLIQVLGAYVKAHDLGIVAGEAGMVRLAPGLVRIPDVCFVAWNQFPGRVVPDDPIPQLAPDLAIEVLSQGNTPAEMLRKVNEYFAAGVRRVWLIDRGTRSARDYRSPADVVSLGDDDSLDGSNVIPGFRMLLAELFGPLN